MNIFDETLVIVVESTNVGGVHSINGKAGYVTLDKSDIDLSNVENISIIATSGYLQNQIDNLSGVSATGDYYPNSNPSGFITGIDLSSYATITNLASTGSTLQTNIINLSGYINSSSSNIVFTTGSQTISGLKNFATRPTVNGVGVLLSGEAANFAGDIGIYNYKANINYDNQYLRQESTLNGQELNFPLSGIKNDDIVNLYFSDPTLPVDNGVRTTYSKTLKVNPGVLVDHNGAISSRNLIKFDDTTQYSGKAIRKVRYNSTIGNGYERILISAASHDTANCPIIRPKTRRLETFYDINVPSGGGSRVFLFRTPTSFPFLQGTCMNLRFNFEADNSPCVISGLVDGTNEHVLTLSGANYNFVQKERVILISKGDNGTTAEFKHW